LYEITLKMFQLFYSQGSQFCTEKHIQSTRTCIQLWSCFSIALCASVHGAL